MSSTPDPVDPDAEFLLELDGDTGAPAAADDAPVAEGEIEESAADAEAAAPVEPDLQLLAAHDLALAALREITPESTIGEPADYRVEADGVVSLRFANRLAGYPGWFWTVSLARVEDAGPTVLEVELLPGDGALLAPDWVPWAVRLADYHAAQAALAEAALADEDADGDELEDVDDLDVADFDDDGSPILHAGDVDGVDIDEFADEAESDDESDEDDDSDDDFDDDDSDDDDDFDDDDSDEDDDSDDEDNSEEDDDFDEDDSDDEDDSVFADDEDDDYSKS